jgi:hypothetical protein
VLVGDEHGPAATITVNIVVQIGAPAAVIRAG